MGYVKWIFLWVFVGFWFPSSHGYTNPSDVFAINGLYAALGFPPLPGWIPFGGDPCKDAWQGVQCVGSNITQIVLSGANLKGRLGESLQNFGSIIQLDLSNNSIGGGIPSSLPITIRSFFLSGNQLTGNIPNTISLLGQLTDLSFNSNNLTGPIPNAFLQLKNLINLDLSGNNLSNQLPPTLASLSSLTTLSLQNNQLVGTLDVLQDLPLKNLNVENNLFSGAVPSKLLNIQNFRGGGNSFNNTVIPLPPSGAPAPDTGSGSAPKIPNSRNGKTKRGIWILIGGILAAAVVLSLGLLFLFLYRSNRRQIGDKIVQRLKFMSKRKEDHHSIYHLPSLEDGSRIHTNPAMFNTNKETKKTLDSISKQEEHHSIDHLPSLEDGSRIDTNPAMFNTNKETKETLDSISKQKEDHHSIDHLPSLEDGSRIDKNPALSNKNKETMKTLDSIGTFSVATLQQYTDSFSQENLIGRGFLGSVFIAKLPTGELLAVKKLDITMTDEQFIKLACDVSKLRHGNVAEMMGYCCEHGQRLIVYKYYQNGTIHEALHSNENIHKNLSWNTRIHLALGSARTLKYLHEVCEPPVVHQNFTSSNILLDDQLSVRVSDCGLAPALPPESLKQLLNDGYGAPEVESGVYTCKSDVYSFGILMLELLTGRKSCDRSRGRGEQFLVRWAIPQLHDIDSLSKMVDPSLNGTYPTKSLSRIADIISLCVQPEPEFRPLMSEIVEILLHLI